MATSGMHLGIHEKPTLHVTPLRGMGISWSTSCFYDPLGKANFSDLCETHTIHQHSVLIFLCQYMARILNQNHRKPDAPFMP